jgi:hypothetical protein
MDESVSLWNIFWKKLQLGPAGLIGFPLFKKTLKQIDDVNVMKNIFSK